VVIKAKGGTLGISWGKRSGAKVSPGLVNFIYKLKASFVYALK